MGSITWNQTKRIKKKLSWMKQIRWKPTWSHGKTLCGSYKNNEERHVNSDGQVMSIPFGENWGNACNSCLGWMKKKSTALKGKKEKWCCKTYALGVFIESKCGQSALQHNLESDEKDQEEVELDEANKVE